MPKNFEDLEIWKTAHKLTLQVYEKTAKWPENEKYNLTSQVRRAAVSTELLIAEGHSRYHNKDIIHFMHESRSSAQEVRNCLMLGRDLPQINLTHEEFNYFNSEYIGLIKGINSFIQSMR